MTEQALSQLKEELNQLLADVQRFCFVTRGREYQEAACQRIDVFVSKAAALKNDAIARADEESANLLLGCQELAQSFKSELLMWVALKDDEPSQAWDSLISAEEELDAAVRAHATLGQVAGRAKRLRLLESVLFPPQKFVSSIMVVNPGDCTCSICGSIYGQCAHVSGRAYMGSFCAEVVHHIQNVSGVDFVDEPFDRRCRVYAFEQEGVTRDMLTWRAVPAGKPATDTQGAA